MMDEVVDALFKIPPGTVVGRLALACALGAVIGVEREIQQKAAGLRTNMLTALAAAAFALLSLHAVDTVDAASGLSDALRIDPLRVFEAISGAAAVLAAGTVIASRGQVSGLTTGVTLWLTAAIGAGVGLGFYGLSILATLFAVATLALLAQVERRREE